MDRSGFEDQTFEKIDYRQKPLPKGEYEYCVFRNCDFSGTDLSEILFLECEFSGCNLRNAVNYTIDPATNKLKKASFSLYGLPDLLAQYDIRIELNA